MPVAFALTGAKADERTTLLDMLDADPDLAARHPGQTIIGDRHYYGARSSTPSPRVTCVCCAQHAKGEPPRAATPLFKPLRQTIESINQTFKGQLDLERHGGRTEAGVIVRVAGRVLALTARSGTTTRPASRSPAP